MGSDCNGSNSEDMVLKVPVGTIVKDASSGQVLHDLSVAGEVFVAARGAPKVTSRGPSLARRMSHWAVARRC